jgi:hypothetical protein
MYKSFVGKENIFPSGTIKKINNASVILCTTIVVPWSFFNCIETAASGGCIYYCELKPSVKTAGLRDPSPTPPGLHLDATEERRTDDQSARVNILTTSLTPTGRWLTQEQGSIRRQHWGKAGWQDNTQNEKQRLYDLKGSKTYDFSIKSFIIKTSVWVFVYVVIVVIN